MKFNNVKLGDICTIQRGSSPRPIKNFIVEEGIPWVKIADATADSSRFISKTREFIKPEGIKKSRPVVKGDLILSNSATPGLPKIMKMDACIHDGWLLLRDFDGVLKDYLYYVLVNKRRELVSNATGTVFNNLKTETVKNFKVKIPDIITQKKIINVLQKYDEKIELNNSIISNLEELAQTLFKRWFVDFEFPNEEGKPYKSSGGKMVESELGLIPEGWKLGVLKDITINLDRKRVPLSKMEREKRKKVYPYYGAASLMDYVDDYLFEGVHVLMGEDGTVIDDDGYPVLQYVWGKFWVNNHAHVLKGKDEFSSEYIYLLLKQTNVTNIVTGAVQPKINQTNLNNISVIIPNKRLIKAFNFIINSLFEKIRKLNDKNNKLEVLRDTLLPKLLSGEIELPDEEKVMELV